MQLINSTCRQMSRNKLQGIPQWDIGIKKLAVKFEFHSTFQSNSNSTEPPWQQAGDNYIGQPESLISILLVTSHWRLCHHTKTKAAELSGIERSEFVGFKDELMPLLVYHFSTWILFPFCPWFFLTAHALPKWICPPHTQDAFNSSESFLKGFRSELVSGSSNSSKPKRGKLLASFKCHLPRI